MTGIWGKTTAKESIRRISPLILIIVNYFSSHLLYRRFASWCWVPILAVYYFLIAVIVFMLGENGHYREWFAKSKGRRVWRVMGIVFFSLFSLPYFVMNISLLNNASMIVLSIVYSLVNPFFEELYWRRVLLTGTKTNGVLSVFISSIFFTVNHPAAFSLLNTTFTEPGFLVVTFMYGLMWSLLFKKTGSLRWNYATHAMVNFASLSVLVFMNVYVPAFSM